MKQTPILALDVFQMSATLQQEDDGTWSAHINADLTNFGTAHENARQLVRLMVGWLRTQYGVHRSSREAAETAYEDLVAIQLEDFADMNEYFYRNADELDDSMSHVGYTMLFRLLGDLTGEQLAEWWSLYAGLGMDPVGLAEGLLTPAL